MMSFEDMCVRVLHTSIVETSEVELYITQSKYI